MSNERLLVQTENAVRDRMSEQAAGHGIDHVMRVLKNAKMIHEHTGGERIVIELAAVLHDVGDAKFHDGVERSGEYSREILSELGADAGLIEKVAHIVDNISFRKRETADELSLEGKVVQDADRLDALGAIGIVRTIEYGAEFDQPFYVHESEGQKTGVGHFYEKLFKLKGLMNTEAARKIAAEREKFMRQFLQQFFDECEIDAGR
ncbi:MAG: HD domain-containing protein [Rhodopirellula sp. JB044]|uniref:HD domain-containing protein n=1 Tax=Rhodopirellula sp. JB044 TaxID=3342844 RepID=UPI003709C725